MAKISDELNFFLDKAGITALQLAQESGVHEVDICRLRLGRVKDTSSTKADALRAAMTRINTEVAERAFQEQST